MLVRRLCSLPERRLQQAPSLLAAGSQVSTCTARLAPTRIQPRRSYIIDDNDDFVNPEFAAETGQAKKRVVRKKVKIDPMETLVQDELPRYSARVQEKIRMRNLAYKSLHIPEAEVSDYRLTSVMMAYRRPILFPPLARYEEAWVELSQRYSIERSRKQAPYKKSPEIPPDIPPDLKPGDRITSADRAGDVRTTARKLDQQLYLIVKRAADRGGHSWGFPQSAIKQGETMRDATLRTFSGWLGADLVPYLTASMPAAHLFYNFSGPIEGLKGSMSFYYPLEVLKGSEKMELAKLPCNKGPQQVEDFAWLTKEELKPYLHPSLFKAVDHALVGTLGSEEFRNFDKVVPPKPKSFSLPPMPGGRAPEKPKKPSAAPGAKKDSTAAADTKKESTGTAEKSSAAAAASS
jgi:large subunit ribosomal protein L46